MTDYPSKIGMGLKYPGARLVSIKLEPHHVELARRLGNGNITAGIRAALDMAAKQEQGMRTDEKERV